MTTRRYDTRRETRRRTRVGVGLRLIPSGHNFTLACLPLRRWLHLTLMKLQVEENIKVGLVQRSWVPSSKRPTSRSISLEPATTNQTDESSPL